MIHPPILPSCLDFLFPPMRPGITSLLSVLMSLSCLPSLTIPSTLIVVRVSRSDCTQINPNEQITFSYLSGNWVAETVTSSITFAACQGYRGNNNNLFAYMQRLYYVEKKITSSQLAAVNKVIVGDNNCASATAYFMQQKGYQTGFNGTLALPSSAFTQVGGGGGFQMERPGADLTFSTLYNSSQTGIVLRICGDCAEPQRRIFVRYLPGFRPPNAFFMCLA